MTKAPINLQELRRRIYRKAKSEKTHRFWGLFVHITKVETLEEAYRIAKSNGGAPGVDGLKFQDIESAGRPAFLAAVREDLLTDRYKPMPNRRVEIPKGNGKFRTLHPSAYSPVWFSPGSVPHRLMRTVPEAVAEPVRPNPVWYDAR